MKPLAVCVLLTWYGWQTVQYLPAWRADVTLWTHAAQMAPMKPRVAVNYGLVLLAEGRIQAGLEAWRRAQQLAQQPHIPSYDKAMTEQRVETNIQRILEAVQ